MKRLGWFVPIVALAIVAAWWTSRSSRERRTSDEPPSPVSRALPPTHSNSREAQADLTAIVEEREHLDRTVWADEVVAQEYEETFVWLWDELRRRSDRDVVLAAFPFGELVVGQALQRESRACGVELTTLGAPRRTLTPDAWRAWLAELRAAGYELVQCEFHHAEFDRDAESPPRSRFNTTLHIRNRTLNRRLIVQGRLHVLWSERRGPTGHHVPERIDASEMTIRARDGDPGFREAVVLESPQNPKGEIQPLLVSDLDDDGLSDIVLAGCNTVYWNRSRPVGTAEEGSAPLGIRFTPAELCRQSRQSVTAAVLDDFTGDGVRDLIVAGENDFPFLYIGEAGGRFPKPPRRIADIPALVKPLSMTSGDIDGDGDQDLWISQYKAPYLGGQMPTPYYDANDGYPSYLLVNQGTGWFEDKTEAAGLGAKRDRRTYSNSFADLDADGDLDLLVASDFAGVDIYENTGSGRFADVTDTAVDQRENFGMSHVFGDFDGDSRLDFYVTGMSSTTARRLEYMGLARADHETHAAMRMRMGYGNRMYLGVGDGNYRQAGFNDLVARTGWSWGVSAFDFDNDGDLEIYVANGHMSRESAKDYCTRFWCHDIYSGSSEDNPQLASFFAQSGMQVISEGVSWNGFEHNKLFANEDGESFLDVAFLMDVAFEFDSRAVVSDDLDADGRVDLVVVQAESLDPQKPPGDRLHVLRNEWPQENNWIGVRLANTRAGRSPIGARITVSAGGRRHVAHIVNGDSFRAQHSATRHFGLGRVADVESIEVAWLDGSVSKVERPAINRYHSID